MKLCILDKDGTLVRSKSGETFVQHPEDQELIPGVEDGLIKLIDAGFTLAIASNQGGVAAGHKTLDQAIDEMQYCLKLLNKEVPALLCPDFEGNECIFVSLDGVYEVNRCWSNFLYVEVLKGLYRKPKTGMVEFFRWFFSAEDSLISTKDCLFIGDRQEDKERAANEGIRFIQAEDFHKGNF